MSNTTLGFSEAPERATKGFRTNQRVDVIIFTILQVAGGQLLLPLLVLTIFLSKRVKRHPVFINFCISWIASSVTFCLLIYQGRNQDGPLNSLSRDSCIAQASLINGVQGLTVSTTLALVVHLWMILFLQSSSNPDSHQRITSAFMRALLGLPYFVFLAFFLVSIVFARDPMAMPMEWGRQIPILPVFICTVPLDAGTASLVAQCLKLQLSVSIFSLTVSIICVLFEAHAAVMIYMKQKSLNKIIGSGWLGMLLRLGFFSVFRTFSTSWDMSAMVAANESALNKEAMATHISSIGFFLQAAIPLVAFITFATEKDILCAWLFRKGHVESESEESISASSNTDPSKELQSGHRAMSVLSIDISCNFKL